jgi:hypothetical protein
MYKKRFNLDNTIKTFKINLKRPLRWANEFLKKFKVDYNTAVEFLP